jgi:hypothetical protein
MNHSYYYFFCINYLIYHLTESFALIVLLLVLWQSDHAWMLARSGGNSEQVNFNVITIFLLLYNSC